MNKNAKKPFIFVNNKKKIASIKKDCLARKKISQVEILNIF